VAVDGDSAMLTIGKIAPGKTEYLIASVAHGAEDYYTGSGEAAGVWLGAGLAGLGIEAGEEVTAEGLARILAGEDPTTGESLLDGARSQRTIPGFDATCSAPKSVSVLWALGDEAVREAVREAHDEAVVEATTYLESELAYGRRGHGGTEEVEGRGLVMAAFRHRSSRAGDPQLHSHVVVANLTQRGDDGKWGAIVHPALYASAKTSGYLYQASLRAKLSERLGVSWSEVTNGHAEIAGVDPDLCRRFSRRAQEIEEAAAAQGITTRAARQRIIMETRRPKPGHREATEWSPDAGDYGVEPSDSEGLHDRWARETAAMGWDPAELAGTLGQAQARTPTEEEIEAASNRLAGPSGLTEQRSTFGRGQAIQAWCETPGMATAGAAEAVTRTDAWLAGDEVQALRPGRKGKYTTQDLLRCERRLIDSAESRKQAQVGMVAPEALAAALGARTLSPEQEAMVRALTTSGAGVDIAIGRAGTGKTYALDAAREAWESSGHQVIGCALAARAAEELAADAGIQSSTMARLLISIRQDGGLVMGAVVVCDETGMVGTRDLARLERHVAAASGKLVIVGDPRQLSEIEAGGALRGLAARLGHTELTEVRRQHDPADIEALAELRHGSVEVGMAHLGRAATVTDTAQEAHAAMVSDWWEARESGASTLMLASRRGVVEDLNRTARAKMMAAGRLGADAMTVEVTPQMEYGRREWQPPEREYREGDEVAFGRNPTGKWKHLRETLAGAHNGSRGRVTGVDAEAGTVTVRLAADPHEAARYGQLRQVQAEAIETLRAEIAGLDAESPERIRAESRLGRMEANVSAGMVGQGRGKPLLGDPGREVEVPADYIGAGWLAHGYASTTHKAQGATVDQAFVLGSDDMTREAGYVALSRHRDRAHLYIVAGGLDRGEREGPAEEEDTSDPLARLTASLQRSGAEQMASDQWGRDGVTRMQRVRDLARLSLPDLADRRLAAEATIAAHRPPTRPDKARLAQARQAAVEARQARQAAEDRVELARRRERPEAEVALRNARLREALLAEAYTRAREEMDEGLSASQDPEALTAAQERREAETTRDDIRAAERRHRAVLGRAAVAVGDHPLLGCAPHSRRDRQAWERAAGEVEGYRERWGRPVNAGAEAEGGQETDRVRAMAAVAAIRPDLVAARGQTAEEEMTRHIERGMTA
jgi:conjugative relaxase-like TrwC/TraI family protein